MASTGDRLRTERERRRLTVQQAAKETNIKADHIRAIEAGDWGAFAAPVYVRGFVRTYARHLRLDEQSIATQLDEDLSGLAESRDASNTAGLRRGPLDFVMLKLALLRWQVLFPVGLGLAVLLAVWWGWKSWQDQPAREAPAAAPRLYQPRTTTVPATLPLPPVTNATPAVRPRP